MQEETSGAVDVPVDGAPADHPVVLFDGVCNLCNSAVNWLLERDVEGRLHYASLQSRAARTVLAKVGISDPGTLPDSIILVDADGVHLRSAAALRIGAHLGFPFSLGRVALWVPRPIRDAVYALIARNRYRWFGRRDVCMRPTPELTARFLDAEEPVEPIPHEVGPVGGAGSEPSVVWQGLKSWLTRFSIAYLLIYMLPFPLSLIGYIGDVPLIGDIPGLGAVLGFITGLWGAVLTPLTTWTGAAVFGVEAVPAVTGSGDQTFNYVQLFTTAMLALVAGTVWWLRGRTRQVSPRVFDVSRTIARFYLATILLTYGWVKVFPLQFPAPGPDRFILPYGDSSPMGLAWTFLGASAAYQIFGGLMELIGGYLLFWRRTSLVGALFAAAVMTNVMAINYFYDVPVKLFSTHLLMAAIFIMAPDLPRLVGLFGFNLPTRPRIEKPFWASGRRRLIAVMALHLILVGMVTNRNVTNNLERARSSGYLAAQSTYYGVYRVESFERAGVVDRANEDDVRWTRVGINPPFVATVQWASGVAERMRISLDEEARTISFFDRGEDPPTAPQFQMTRLDGGGLRLEGTLEGEPTIIVLARSEQAPLLVERGFHWINEFPLNR